jgi:poly-gamma-glutamate synthesis protein (capsule biosynthesis protein)
MRLTGILLSIVMMFNINPNFTSVLAQRYAALEKSVTLSFVGDCNISTYLGGSSQGSFNWYAKNYEPTYFFQNVADIFNSDDFTIANCETVLTDRNLTSRAKDDEVGFWFYGPSSNAKIFSSSGVEIAGVVNNHTEDYGSEGLSDTIAALEAEGIEVLKRNKPIYVEKDGIKIGILAAGIWYGGAEKNIYSTLDDMKNNSDVQIIYVHGGEESTHTPEAWRKTSFRNLIDRGADLVVACHAHVLQPMEEYNGGTIVYGLGNFCFGGNRSPENRTAIYQCKITKTDGELSYENKIIPCYVYTGSTNNWQPALIDENDANYQKILDFMAGNRDTPV